MSFTIQQQIKNNSTDIKTYLDDLYSWEDSVKKSSPIPKKPSPDPESLPPVRGKVTETSDPNMRPPSDLPQNTKLKRDGNTVSDYYKAWDKFDPDSELKKLEEEEKNLEYKPPKIPERPPGTVQKEGMAPARTKMVIKGGRNITSEFETIKDKANLHYRNHEYAKALELYSQAIEKVPNTQEYYTFSATILSNRAMTHIKLQDFVRAEQDCESALKLAPEFPKAFLRRGMCRRKMGKLKIALSDFKRALELDPSNAELPAEIQSVEQSIRMRRERAAKSLIVPVRNESKKWVKVEINDIGLTETLITEGVEDLSNLKFSVEEKTSKTEEKPEETQENNDSLKRLDNNKENINKQSPFNDTNSEESRKKPSELSYDFVRLKEIDRVSKLKLPKVQGNFEEITRKRVVFGGETEMEFGPLKKLPLGPSNVNPILKKKSLNKKPVNSLGSETDKRSVGLSTIIEKGKTSMIQTILKETTISTMTSAKFFSSWRTLLPDPQAAFSFMKGIEPKDLPQIFKDSIETATLIEILGILSQNITNNGEFIRNFLLELPRIRRFDIAVGFMLGKEKVMVQGFLDGFHNNGVITQDEYKNFLKLYGVRK